MTLHTDKKVSLLLRAVAAAGVVAVLAGCSSVQEVYVNGQIYDGATGERLTSYQMTLEYRDRVVSAQVSDSGRFLTNLPTFQDYTVVIQADGYRTFRSHNKGFNVPNPDSTLATAHGTQTLYFDAYLFPSRLVAPAVKLNVREGTSTGDFATGKMRLRPISSSSIADSLEEVPAGVPLQLWTNDEDLQAKPILRDFSRAGVDIAANELVYGVKYLVNVYEVQGFQPLEADIVAGVDESKTLVLMPENSEPLTLVSSTVANCAGPSSPNDTEAAIVLFEFNTEVELAGPTSPLQYAELVDNAFQIASVDDDGDLRTHRLWTSASSSEQERGTRMNLQGKTLTFRWNPSAGLQLKDNVAPFDVISATWNLSGVKVQAVGRKDPKDLVSLVPQAVSISCDPQ